MKITACAPRAPGEHSCRWPVGVDREIEPVAVLRQDCRHLRQQLALLRVPMQSSDAADESVDIMQVVRLVGQIKNPFLLRKSAPIEVQRFEWPVRIVRAE